MELTSYYLAIIEKKLVILDELIERFSSLTNEIDVLQKFHVRKVYGKLRVKG